MEGLPRLERTTGAAALTVLLVVLTVRLAILTVVATTTSSRRRGRRRYRHRTGVVILVGNLVLVRLLRIRVRRSLEARHHHVLIVPLGV